MLENPQQSAPNKNGHYVLIILIIPIHFCLLLQVHVQTVIEIDADVANDASGSEQQQQAADDDGDVYVVSRSERSEPEHADDRLHDNDLDLLASDDGIAEDKEDEVDDDLDPGVNIEEVIEEDIVEAMKEEEEDEVAFLGWFPGSEA